MSFYKSLREKSSQSLDSFQTLRVEKNRSGSPKREDSFWGKLFVSKGKAAKGEDK